ncbi:MAG TPA: AAA family ATPase, partial [Actinomycetes bacterium]
MNAAGATAPGPPAGVDGDRASPAHLGLDGDRASLVHLRGRLAVVEAAVRAAVARRRQADPGADDPFRGLYLAEEQVDRLLDAVPAPPAAIPAAATAEVEAAADRAERAGAELRLRRLARGFGLDPLDLGLLLVALAPDLDPRFERLYAYLNDDVTRRRAQVGLALELCGASPTDAAARSRLGRGGTLVAGGLVEVEEPERPFLTRPLRVPDRVASHLLGDDTLDPDLAAIAGAGGAVGRDAAPAAGTVDGPAAGLARALAAGARLAYVRERPGGSGTAVAAAGLRAAGLPALVLDLGRLDAEAAPAAVARAAAREARLRGAGLVAGPVEALTGRGAAAVRAFAELPATVVLAGRMTWDPAWARDVPAVVEAPGATTEERAACWRAHLDGAAGPPRAGPAGDPGLATAHFLLSAEQVARAAAAARLQAAVAGTEVTPWHLRAGARAQNAAGLERLARRIEPAVGWDDLVLPGATAGQLRELAARARHRDRVLADWGLRPGGGRGRGVTALFAGDSGTGKTMSAEVIAGALGLDLYAVNLATVVDKYVGETEKNL